LRGKEFTVATDQGNELQTTIKSSSTLFALIDSSSDSQSVVVQTFLTLGPLLPKSFRTHSPFTYHHSNEEFQNIDVWLF
jgi:hypothetical protein